MTSLPPLLRDPRHETLTEALAAAATGDAGLALVAQDGTETYLTYRALYDNARGLAGALAAAGVKAGDRVMIALPTSFELIELFFAVELAGAIPVPTYPPGMMERREAAEQRLAHIARHSGASTFVTDPESAASLTGLKHGSPALQRTLLTTRLRDDAFELDRAAPLPSDPGFIQYTSGSTGAPKGVLLSHASLIANIRAIGIASRFQEGDRTVSWLPLYHDMGLIGALLTSIYWGLPLVLMSPTTFMMKPALWLEAISRHRGTLSPAPNFAYAVCVKRVKEATRANLDLSSWRLALNGAEPVSLDTMRDFTEAFAPCGFDASAIFPVYGLAESCLAVTFPEPGAPLLSEVIDRTALSSGRAMLAVDGVTVVAVGRALPGHEVRVVNDRGQSLPERAVGQVIARGPSIMTGYFEDEAATTDTVRDGWLYTGDLGYFADGQLYVTGRCKDIIIVKGRNHYAEDIERVAESVDGVRKGSAVAFSVYDDKAQSEALVVLCETKLLGRAQVKLAERVQAEVGAGCGLRARVEVFEPRTLPRTSSGKRQRALSRQLYASGTLRPIRTALGRAVRALQIRALIARERARAALSSLDRSAA